MIETEKKRDRHNFVCGITNPLLNYIIPWFRHSKSQWENATLINSITKMQVTFRFNYLLSQNTFALES